MESDHGAGLGGDSPAVSVGELYRSEKLSQAAIARRLSLSRNTVAKALQADAPPPVCAAGEDLGVGAGRTGGACAAHRLSDDARDGDHPEVGWSGGHSWFAENVTRIRLEYAPPDPCDRSAGGICPASRSSAIRGSPAQLVPDHAGVLRSFPVLVMVTAYSRFIAAK